MQLLFLIMTRKENTFSNMFGFSGGGYRYRANGCKFCGALIDKHFPDKSLKSPYRAFLFLTERIWDKESPLW